ncbi:MAG: hypothetical protein Q9168_004694 [Polycauliona sp. 1 TL-2023]
MKLLLILLLAIAATAVHRHHRSWEPPKSIWAPRGRSIDDTYDYIVVGGGTAGLTVAARLAEDGSRTVAVIEAGGYYEQDNGNISIVPGYSSFFSGTDPTDLNPLVDWAFVTQPLTNVDNRRLHYARGKTLGGSSARNYLYYHRPNAGFLDKWADAVGDDGYKFNNLLPFFKKSVHYTAPVNATNSTSDQDPNAWSSTGGPLQCSYGKYVDPFGTWVQPAAQKLGFEEINGFQSGSLLGSAYIPFTVDPIKSQRSSSESSFLQSVPQRARLQIYHHALAEKILLDNNTVAEGVLVSSNGTTFTLKARREVILSAGVFQSPQLLMLSGIGPAETLARYNIPLRVDSPGVGANLRDHPWFSSQYRVLVPTASAGINDGSSLAVSWQMYEASASGPLSIPAPGFIAWEKAQNVSASTRQALDEAFTADWPDLEYVPIAAALGYHRDYQKEDPMDGYNYASLGTILAAPLSQGTVSISSASASDPPLIDPNYLSHPADVELAILAIRRQRDFWAQMKDITIGDEFLPGLNVTSDADILQFVKDALSPAWHGCGTCRMGKENSQSVVDSRGRVYGAKNLRVVDASVFPFLPPGHIQGTVYAVAEKIADDIVKGGHRVGRWPW